MGSVYLVSIAGPRIGPLKRLQQRTGCALVDFRSYDGGISAVGLRPDGGKPAISSHLLYLLVEQPVPTLSFVGSIGDFLLALWH